MNSEIKLEKATKETYQRTPDEEYVFTDRQYELFEKLKNSNHYSFSGPTSFGKSFIIEEFIKYIIKERKGIDNIAILVPTRALISQIREQLKNNLKEIDNYKIIEYPEIPYMFNKNKYIFIFTPERLIAYLGNQDNPNIDYMFIDEAQKIISNKDTRAPLYYHAILLAQRKSIKLFFSAPNISNADIFLKIFEKSQTENMILKESPVTQNRFYIDLFENKYYAINDENEIIEIESNLKQ
jgi:ERCC4-related helicase